ncbi:3'-5' exonuclease, partial [Treponema sp. R6D11]
YRTNAQSLGFETLFLRRGIPYRVVGSLKFYEREEIKDALALLSFIVNPRDEVNFRRVVNKPARGVGAVTVDKIVEAAGSCGGNLIEAGRNLELTQKARSGLNAFYKVIEDAKELLESGEALQEDGKALSGSEKTDNKKKKHKGLVPGTGLSDCVTKIVKDS